MVLEDTFVFVLAGGEGRRLRPLTKARPKPTLPFAGNACVIDFTLANCARSGLTEICVLGQYRSAELEQHLRSRWPGVALRTPQRAGAPGGYRGTAHAVACNLDLLAQAGIRQVLVTASDHVYWMEYGRLLQAHRERGAAATVAGVEVDLREAGRFGIMVPDGDGRIVGFEEKPAFPQALPGRPDQALASMGVYVFDVHLLRQWLQPRAAGFCRDFGGDLLPALVEKGEEVYAHVFGCETPAASTYWRDIGSVHSYWRSSLEMVHPASPHRVGSAGAPFAPGCGCRSCLDRVGGCSVVEHALISCGPPIRNARIERSVLCCGVAVGEDVRIEDAVILEGAQIGRGVWLRGVVVDRGAVIPPGIRLQSRHADPWNGGPETAAAVVPGLREVQYAVAAVHPVGLDCGDCSSSRDGCGCQGWGSVSPYGREPGEAEESPAFAAAPDIGIGSGLNTGILLTPARNGRAVCC